MMLVVGIAMVVVLLAALAAVPLVLLRSSRHEPQLADPARVRQLEYELDFMDDAERELHEYVTLQRRTSNWYAENLREQARARRGTQSAASLTSTLKDMWATDYRAPVVDQISGETTWPRSPFYRDPNGGTYVVNEDATGMWHEYSDGRRVFVRAYNEHR